MTVNFETTVYFGDSLSDDGNLYALTSDALFLAWPPDLAGYTHKFSNGPLWSEIAPAQLGSSTTLNYAYGGAKAVGVQTLEDYMAATGLNPALVKDASYLGFDLNLTAQVQRFLIDHAGEDLSGVSASLLVGLNDYASFVPTSNDPAVIMAEAQALIAAVTTATIQAALVLAEAGVGQIVLNTLPKAQFLPLLENLPEPLKSLAPLAFAAHNDILVAQADALSALGINVQIVDLEALSGEIVDDPSTFGFIAPLWDSVLGNMGGNPLNFGFEFDQVGFYDEVHPTEAGHGVIGIFHAESLTSDVQIGSDANEVLVGARGEDLVLASGGNDEINLGSGDDVALGGLGDDTISGGRDDDILSGGSGMDSLMGGHGNDVLAGGRGDDVLEGGIGNDVLIDGLGCDFAYGGNGDDIFLFTDAALIGGVAGADTDTFVGGNGYDRLYLALSSDVRSLYEESLAISNSSSAALADIGICVVGVESVILVNGRAELASVETEAALGQADLWGFV